MTPDSCNDEKETFDITIVHDDHPIKEITTSAAYNERSLIEDICTIAGVLFSALQLPWLITKLVDYCKHDEPIAQNREESDDRIDDNDVGNGTSINLLIQNTALKSQITTLEDRLNKLEKIGKYSREESEDVIYDNDLDQVASNSLVVPNYNMSDTVVWIKETAG